VARNSRRSRSRCGPGPLRRPTHSDGTSA
jgi:hypothetical protein